jgi:hypothetical protein
MTLLRNQRKIAWRAERGIGPKGRERGSIVFSYARLMSLDSFRIA